MPNRKAPKITPEEGAQSIGALALLIGGGIAYLSTEVFLIVQPHPFH